MKILALLLSASLLCNTTFADDAISLSKGQAAPWDGVLMTTERAQTARKAELELPKYKLINESLEYSLGLHKENNSFLKDKVVILTGDNQMLATALVKERSSNDLMKIVCFVGGIVVTVLAIEGASKLR